MMKEKGGILSKYLSFEIQIEKISPNGSSIKGGGRIHTYVIAVVFAGILMTFLLGRLARIIGLRPREVMLSGLFIVVICVVFPFMLQRGLVWEWGLITTFILGVCVINFKQPERKEQILSPPGVRMPSNGREKSWPEVFPEREAHNVSPGSEDKQFYIEREKERVQETILRENNGRENESWLLENLGDFCPAADHDGFSLDEMLERGFAAKEQLNFAEAAKWFLKVWAANPAPDIQVYLVMDLYEFGKALNRETEARKLVRDFQQRALPALPPEMQDVFNHWLALNNLASHEKQYLNIAWRDFSESNQGYRGATNHQHR